MFVTIMYREMGWKDANPYEYHPERGLYYHEVWPGLYCGTQPQSRQDVDSLAELLGEGGSILSLQQDKDLQYWKIPSQDIQAQARHHGLIYHRCPVLTLWPTLFLLFTQNGMHWSRLF